MTVASKGYKLVALSVFEKDDIAVASKVFEKAVAKELLMVARLVVTLAA